MAKTLTNQGFFISPTGKLIAVDNSGTHIGTVINNPKQFGIDPDEIKAIYKKNRETFRTEGKAREIVLKGLTDKGWIRLRRYPNRYWSVQFAKMNPKVRKVLGRWAAAMVKGQGGYKEKDKYMPVIAMGFADGFKKQVEIDTIAKTGTIGEGIDMVDIRDYDSNELTMESIMLDFSDIPLNDWTGLGEKKT